MTDIGDLIAQPLDPGRRFNWIFLVELIVCGILTLFFLFYSNRLFATLVSYGIRAYSWHKFRVYIDIQSLQVSLLGGRVFFKGVRYHGENESILIQHGFITWNYWLRAVKQADYVRFADNKFHRSVDSKQRANRATDKPAARSSEAGGAKAAKDLPCRITVSVSGAEWFIYNRSPLYESIAASQSRIPEQHVAHSTQDDGLESATVHKAPKEYSKANTPDLQWSDSSPKSFSAKPNSSNSSGSAFSDAEINSRSHRATSFGTSDLPAANASIDSSRADCSAAQSSRDLSANAPAWTLALFPILIECQKGAIVIGNEHTPVILNICFDRSSGLIDAAEPSPQDRYRQLFEFEVTHPIVQMKPNPDYRQSQQRAAHNAIRDPLSAYRKTSWWKTSSRFLRRRKRRVVNSVRNLVPQFRGSVESFRRSSVSEKETGGRSSWPSELPGESRWLGLSRYLTDHDRDSHEGWSTVEYARFSNVVDCPSVHLSFYWDVPGPVQAKPSKSAATNTDANINLAKPPEYGLDIILRGGSINYGPWADRARAEIQSILFPNAYQDAVLPDTLPIGAPRQSTMLNINIHLENNTSFRIPTRESSKDRHWNRRAVNLHAVPDLKQQRQDNDARKTTGDGVLGPERRPFGWIATAVCANSTITYNMDLVSRKEGYRNELELDLKGTKTTTSVNHALLWNCGPQKITCNLSNPPVWNSAHEWSFDVQNHDMELFLLRDHVFLLTDLITDFTSGPPGEFLTFVPFLYHVNFSFDGVKLFLNANDSNIIDSPCDVDENNFLVLHGEHLDLNVNIPLTAYAPSQSEVGFKARARDATLDIIRPVWNTAHSFTSDLPTATLKDFSMEGSYSYFSTTSANLTDTLFLSLSGTSPRIYLLGSLIRQCMNLKDNYGGDDVHFRTFEEYRKLLFKPKNNNIDVSPSQNEKSNGLDVILDIVFDQVCVLLPANIYSRRENLRLDFLFVEVDIRFTNYYMDLEANFSPVEASWETNQAEKGGTEDYTSNTQAFVDGLAVYGHRLFGASPSEPTYVCNWDFDVGKVTGDCSVNFLRIFLKALRAFAFILDDDENALPPSPLVPLIHDITFLRAKIDSVNLWFVPDETAILLEAGSVAITFNDWAGKRFSDRLNMDVQFLKIAAVNYKSALRHQDKAPTPIQTHAVLELSVLLRMVQRKRNMSDGRALQQQHILAHDQRTSRTPWLLHELDPAVQPRGPSIRSRPSPPSMPIPNMPVPLSRRDPRGKADLSLESLPPKASLPLKLRDDDSSSSEPAYLYNPGSISAKRGSSHSTAGNHSLSRHRCVEPRSSTRLGNGVQQANTANTARGENGRSQAVSEGTESKGPKSSKTCSSPWTTPSFRLQNVVPDCREMPEKPDRMYDHTTTKPSTSAGIETTLQNSEDSSRSDHTRFDIDCGPAIRGFASPTFFSALATMLQDLQPLHPIDLLDDLQMSTMSSITSAADTSPELVQRTDFCLRTPFIHLRMLNRSPACNTPEGGVYQDRFDLQLTGTQLIARSKSHKADVNGHSGSDDGLCLHLVVRRGLLEVCDQSSATVSDGPAARLSIRDATLWTVSDRRTLAKFQQQALELAVSSSQVNFLVSLIDRTSTVSDSLIDQFAQAGSVTCVERLVYHLTEEASGVTDPPCLTRPSYVLRIADQHLRLHDSWKILSRLRHILQSFDRPQERSLLQQIAAKSPLPADAEAVVLENFDDWRSWDLAHVRNTLIMRNIWQRSSSVSSTQNPSSNISFELTMETARLLLNPGKWENRSDIHNISAAFSTRAVTGDSTGFTDARDERSILMGVEIYCSHFDIALNWDMVNLIDSAAKSYIARDRTQGHSPQQDKQASRSAQQLHVFAGTDGGELTVDGINVTVAMSTSGLSGSLIHEAKPGQISTTSVLVRSNAASADLKTNERSLITCLLDKFTLSLSQAVSAPPSPEAGIINTIGKCEALRFELKRDIGSCLQIADCVIKDEGQHIHALVSRLSPKSQPAEREENLSAKQKPDVYVALLLDQYSLSISILPLLTHIISGGMARTSILPQPPAQLAINFDLGRHSHVLRLKRTKEVRRAVELDLPLINGRVLYPADVSPERVRLETTVDKVEIDARSVRACVDIMNRPEVVRGLLDAKKGIQQISLRLDTMNSSESKVDSSIARASKALLYAANLTFIGLRVHASAPALRSKDYLADLDFNLGLTTIHIGNEGPTDGLTYDSPQFDVAMRLVNLKIQRRSPGRLYGCGSLDLSGRITKRTKIDDSGNQISIFHASSGHLDILLQEEIISLAVDIAVHLQERIKSFTLTDEAKRLKPLRRLTIAGLTETPTTSNNEGDEKGEAKASSLFDSLYSLEWSAIKVTWGLGDCANTSSSRPVEDLIFSIQSVKLDTRREGFATLAIGELQLQMAPKSLKAGTRSSNSALMPEIMFRVAYLSTNDDRRLAFQAAGKALDIRLASDFVVPATALRASFAAAHAELRQGSTIWATPPMPSKEDSSNIFSSKYLASMLVDADFAGAVVTIQASRSSSDRQIANGTSKGDAKFRTGAYTQSFQDDRTSAATLRAPGVAMKIEYSKSAHEDPALNAEIKVAASSNVLCPSVVPVIYQISSSVKEIMGHSDDVKNSDQGRDTEAEVPATGPPLASSDPVNLMGRCKLNLGLWIREQEFSLSCQPIARVAATARFDHIFVALNTVSSAEQERFFSLSMNFRGFHASVQHVYSRESTASFEVDSLVLSMMNSKHVSTTTGLFLILNFSPMKASINAKQLQDFLLFREIWYPAELRQKASPTTASTTSDGQGFVVQRYQQVAAAGAFRWNAVISIQELELQVDLGQGLGKSTFTVSKVWASAKKASDLEQNLCLGFDKVLVDSTGRMSGLIELRNFRVRTSIYWPQTSMVADRTPLVQASLGLDEFRLKAVFDYQPFMVAEISKFCFLMYNVSGGSVGEKDRLVGNLEGEKVQVFCTTAAASQAYGLYQAAVRLNQENEAAYQVSLKEVEKHLRPKPVSGTSASRIDTLNEPDNKKREGSQGPFLLHTDVVVALEAVNVGIFPSTFFDNQIFKIEVNDAQAQFAVSARDGKTRSSLGLTLGQLRVALSSVNRIHTQALADVSVSDIVKRATQSRGGTILKVPKVVATMHTWQSHASDNIDYTFKSAFEGKVDVGWNYSRISFIRGMWATHLRALATRLGKPLPQSAVQITGGLQPDDAGEVPASEKITAVVNVPQSRFEYRALEPPIMETPQLRDMGEATPPLEWIGLHRDKLPHVTHQIIIVTLLEIAKKVEDAYSKILGSSP